MQNDGTPHFRLVAVQGEDTLSIQTIALEDGTPIDPDSFTLSGKGNQRLVWNAGEDLGEVFYKEGITVSV